MVKSIFNEIVVTPVALLFKSWSSDQLTQVTNVHDFFFLKQIEVILHISNFIFSLFVIL